jgi:hypothetical protein
LEKAVVCRNELKQELRAGQAQLAQPDATQVGLQDLVGAGAEVFYVVTFHGEI